MEKKRNERGKSQHSMVLLFFTSHMFLNSWALYSLDALLIGWKESKLKKERKKKQNQRSSTTDSRSYCAVCGCGYTQMYVYDAKHTDDALAEHRIVHIVSTIKLFYFKSRA